MHSGESPTDRRENDTASPLSQGGGARGSGANVASSSEDGSAGELQVRILAHSALRCALRDGPRVGSRDSLPHVERVYAPDDETRKTIWRLCQAAQEAGLRGEQVLILLKEAWRDEPEARRAAHDHDGDMLSRVITLCIQEYYAPQRRG